MGLPRPGERVLHYEIVETIGKGGMGIVFRAHDTNLGRDVALKCPWPHLSEDAVARHRFLREARATSRLAHPTIVPVYEVFEDRQLPWIAMELVEEHKTLAEVLISGEPLPLEQILEHAEDLADALRAAHAKGILHRDIKPSNVLLGTDGRARLTDFGLARFFAPADRPPGVPVDEGSSLTVEGKVVGTIAYMAPEVLLGGGTNPDPRSDLYSLGVLLYEMCTGRAAFISTSNYDVYSAVLNREPPAIGRFNYEIPRSLERIVRKALAKRPEERYQDARDLLADVKTVRRKLASGVQDIEDDLDVGRMRSRWVWATWSLGALAAVSVAAAAWMGLQPAPRFMLPFTPRQLTSAPGVETDPAVSPDGTLVAYAAEERGHFDLWVVKSSGGNPIRLTDDEDSDRSPAWFPDNAAIAFVSTRGGREGVWKIPALGGTPTLVVPDASAPAISPDGKRVAFVRDDATGGNTVYVAPVDAPDRAVAAAPNAGKWGQYTPSWSQDGKKLAWADFNNIWVVNLADHKARQVTDGPWGDLKPIWTTDGDIVFTSEAREGTRALWRVQPDGRNLRRLTAGSGPERLASTGRRGSILAYTTFASDTDIGVFDRASGSFSRFGAQLGDFAPTLSQDGRRVFFTSERWGAGGCLAAQDLDGVQPKGSTRRILERKVALSRLSPNGEWIAYWRPVDGERDIWIARSNGGEDIRLDDDPANDSQPAWSPHGDQIAFISERGDGAQVWVAVVSEGRLVGRPRRLTTTGSDRFPEWAPDGRSILFTRTNGTDSDVWSVNADGTGERRLTRGSGAMEVRWPAGSTELFVSGTWGSSSYEVRTVDPGTGASKALNPPAVGTADVLTAAFDVALGGRIIAMTLAETRGDIWILAGDPGSF